MEYSTVTSTGPRSPSMGCIVTGAGQCMEGDRSTSAPVCTARSHGNGSEGPCRGEQERGRQPEPGGDFSPDRAADAQCAEHDGDIHGETATANPLRQGNLRRDAETGEGNDPRSAGEDARDNGGQRVACDPEEPPTDDIWRMQPLLCARMSGTAARVRLTTP
jgi:hypothetical protein